jgi:hypothetical protein
MTTETRRSPPRLQCAQNEGTSMLPWERMGEDARSGDHRMREGIVNCEHRHQTGTVCAADDERGVHSQVISALSLFSSSESARFRG